MENFFEKLMANPDEITFTMLFVGLFVWVMRQNTLRETKYQETINKLADALKDVELIKNTVEKIHEKLK